MRPEAATCVRMLVSEVALRSHALAKPATPPSPRAPRRLSAHPMTETIAWADFERVEIRVGTVQRAEPFPEARKPAMKLWVDFGAPHGVKKTSAKVTVHYTPEALLGRQVLGVLNFPPRQVGKFMSEFLVLGLPDADGAVVLLRPDLQVPDGGRMF
jgi:tRNA-binding protein